MSLNTVRRHVIGALGVENGTLYCAGRAMLFNVGHSSQPQIRCMSKYLSKAAKKRIPLSTKRAHKGFYKGNGATKEGRLTSKGKFIKEPLRLLELVVPDLEGFKLKPYIASTVPKVPPELHRNPVPK